jgi:hypothetical protein
MGRSKKVEEVTPEFKYDMFPVIIVHKDGKDLKDTKTCYFDNESNAKKYIQKSKFKKTDYKMYIKGQTK